MESAYAMANNALAEIRKKNADELKNREREVREKAPEYADIEARLAAGGLALAKCVLNGTSDISEIRRHTEKAQADKAMILKRLNLPENYLDEIYNCEKCRDTGFDENGRRCECLKNMVSKYVGVNSNLTEVMREENFDNFDYTLFASQPDIKGKSVLKIVEKTCKRAKNFADTFEETHAHL